MNQSTQINLVQKNKVLVFLGIINIFWLVGRLIFIFPGLLMAVFWFSGNPDKQMLYFHLISLILILVSAIGLIKNRYWSVYTYSILVLSDVVLTYWRGFQLEFLLSTIIEILGLVFIFLTFRKLANQQTI